MLKLIKYEMMKQKTSKLLIGGALLLVQAMLFAGLLLDDTNMVVSGFLITCIEAFFTVLYIGIESVIFYNEELKTKKGYMVFMTPNSAYKILGAKFFCSGVSLLLTGLVYALVILLDGFAISVCYDGFDEFVRMALKVLNALTHIEIDSMLFLATVVALAVNWISIVMLGYLAVTVSATLLSNRRFNGLISVVVFILLQMFLEWLYRLMGLEANAVSTVYINIVYYFLAALAAYGVSGWMLEKKMDL